MIRQILFLGFCCLTFLVKAQTGLDNYNIVWNSQSANSSESMPCGGGDIGLNVWVENDELMIYLSKSGTFDENNVMPKLGRVRVRFTPNPFEGAQFRQEIKLRQGYVEVTARRGNELFKADIWVEVDRPVAHIDVSSTKPTVARATYESWRYADLEWTHPGQVRASLAFRDAPMRAVIRKDSVNFEENRVCFYHQNRDSTLFDVTVRQQSLEAVKDQMWNPLKGLIFGGYMEGTGMSPDGNTQGVYASTNYRGWTLRSDKFRNKHHISVALHNKYTPESDEWKRETLNCLYDKTPVAKRRASTLKWWEEFWNRSHIIVNAPKDTPQWRVARNYQLFRYQLGCNAYGAYPTKFNGSLFTYDPVYVKEDASFTPDHRDWGGGTFTAQNQRLVYWPMIKSGDFDMMASQFDFYSRALVNAELRVKTYWGHQGACFTEQLENFGLPLATSYGWKRPKGFPVWLQHNAWLEYEWDTSLEFCQMILDVNRYTGADITKYIPLVEKCLIFFDEHYRMEASKRGIKSLDENGKLILYPGSGAETYKMAYNAVSTIAALMTVTQSYLDLPASYRTPQKEEYFKGFLGRIPPITFREMEGHKTIAPAVVWERINNVEITQLYPVYPWGIYGVGKPDLEVAVNTWKYGVDTPEQKDYISWHQDNIFCARLGLTDEAAEITIKKLDDAPRRYPTFWGPGHDWVPDHNWGGSGMIGLQEMLMQVDAERIMLFPAWPKNWDVQFKMHAPYNTTVECEWKDGKVVNLKVTPQSREKDVVIM